MISKRSGGGAEEGWLYRKCPQDNIGTGTRLEKIKGKTLAWNQLIGSISSDTINGVVRTAQSGGRVLVYSGTSTSADTNTIASPGTSIQGHKYLFSRLGNLTNIRVFAHVGFSSQSDESAILIGDGTTIQIRQGYSSGVTVSGWAAVDLIDLTLMFGAGNEPSTVAEFESMFPGYHSYQPGKLISNDAESIETIGFNIWDEEWELGILNETTGQPVSSNEQIRSKNYIPAFPNTAYYCKCGAFNHSNTGYFILMCYDANYNFLGELDQSEVNYIHTTLPGTAYMKFFLTTLYGTTYNHDICINLSDPVKNGTYESYRKSTLPLNLNAIKVKSHNIWDEEWENGFIGDTGASQDRESAIRSKNFNECFGGAVYHVKSNRENAFAGLRWYDINKNYLGMVESGSLNKDYQAPTNAAFFKVSVYNYAPSGTTATYNSDICINVSSSFNGQYEPHGDITITGGLKSAGSIYDEVIGNKYIKRIGEADLGSLDWEHLETERFVSNNIASLVKTYGVSMVMPAVCSEYAVVNSDDTTTNKVISIGYSSGKIYVKDLSYSTIVTFKAAMSGVMLYYELASPIEYELVDAIPYITQYSEYGTQRIISPQSSTPSAPFYGEWQYGIQQGDFISGLENSEFMIGSSTYIISEEEFNEIFGNL